jgi:hypothetical protein
MHPHLECYLVGGAVRDILLGQEAKDKDYCVVNATENDMLAYGFKKVGDDFPVFLHPVSKEEYALARRERKVGSGYGGFVTETKNVTLEEDLFRRDLTINAMAMNKDGSIIDPYNGQADLANKILRHVSSHFAEDPVRILRICRFAARYNFTIAPETKDMMKKMVENGEFDSLTKERVFLEFKKVISESFIMNFFNNLKEIGAIEKLGKFETIFSPELFNLVTEAPTESSKNYFIFHDFNPEQMHNFGLSRNQIDTIGYLKKWKASATFYTYMNDEMKLNFFKDMKSRHDAAPSLELASDIFYIKEIPEDVADFELYILKQDIDNIKNFNNQEYINDLNNREELQTMSKSDKNQFIQRELKNKYSTLLFSHNTKKNKP